VTPAGATRLVSLHDPDARHIAKGRLGKPVEFGHKAQVCDNEDGVILDHDVLPGNPADAPRLAPCIARVIQRSGQTPRVVAADRGYGEQAIDDALHALGVDRVAMPPVSAGRSGPSRQATWQPRGIGLCRLQVLPDASADSLDAFVTASVDVGSRVITDDWQATRAFPRSDTLPTIGEASAPRACEGRSAANCCRWCTGRPRARGRRSRTVVAM